MGVIMKNKVRYSGGSGDMTALAERVTVLEEDVVDLQSQIDILSDDVWGVEIDYDNDYATRLAGAKGLSAGADFDAFAPWQRRRCNLADDGTVNAYYGDSGYVEDGTNGQVMVEQKPFWYKVVPVEVERNTDSNIGYHGKVMRYYVTDKPKTGFKLHPCFYGEARPIYIGAYEASYYDAGLGRMFDDDSDTSTNINSGDLICSLGNSQKPISGLRKNLTKTNFEAVAQHRGASWHLETVQVNMASLILMLIEYGSLNSQSIIGAGVVDITDDTNYNCSSLTGSTSSFGNASGRATSTVNRKGSTTTTETDNGKTSVSYRGVENLWGNIWKHSNGINIWGDGTMHGGVPYICKDYNFEESKRTDNYESAGFSVPNASGYINALGYSNNFDWLMMPSEIGGNTSLPVGDRIYVTPNLDKYKVALLGGAWGGAANVGGFCWDLRNNVGYRGRFVGGRLIYIQESS